MTDGWTDLAQVDSAWWQVALLALVGACVGSFLNVVLYRIPRGMGVNQPPRSFCPACGTPIPWYLNLPIISWLILRGKSACCRRPISPRYPLIESACCLLFGSIGVSFSYEPLLARLLICLWAAGLLAMLVMDWEWMLVHSSIACVCAGCGLVASGLAPLLASAGTLNPWEGVLWGCVGVLCGYIIFRCLAWIGRVFFGRRNLHFAKPTHWELHQIGDDLDIELTIGNHSLRWSTIFTEQRNPSITLEHATVDQIPGSACRIQFSASQILIGNRAFSLEIYDSLSGSCSSVTAQRSAMGSGDAWIAMAIGSLCGWQGVVFSLVVGSLFGLAFALGKRISRGEPMPFGPSLILAALLWLFAGPELVEWYAGLLM